MLRILHAPLLGLALTALPGCAIVYKLPTRQGNVIEQQQLDQLKLGMTREQVHYLLGTPIASSRFEPNRWDYFGYYRPPRGETTSRTVTLYFDGDKLTKMEGVQLAANDNATGSMLGGPDARTIKQQTREETSEAADAEQDKSPAGTRPAPPP